MAKHVVINCPNKKCKSTNVVPITEDKKPSVLGAAVGGALLGPAGALLGAVSGGSKKVKFRCMDCGTVFEMKM